MALDIPRLDGRFEVISDYQPAGDQPTAIADLERRVRRGDRHTVLLGATGTGKSATTAWLIEKLQRPALVLAPNKTLCAQLAKEFRERRAPLFVADHHGVGTSRVRYRARVKHHGREVATRVFDRTNDANWVSVKP